MDIKELDKEKLKAILRVSNGMTSPVRMVHGSPVKPKPAHPISLHVSGAGRAMPTKTKFHSLNDMVEALWAALNTANGINRLKQVAPGKRVTLDQGVRKLVSIEVQVGGVHTTFTTGDQGKAGIHQTQVFAVLEGRERDGQLHLHIQSCYPKLSAEEFQKLAAGK